MYCVAVLLAGNSACVSSFVMVTQRFWSCSSSRSPPSHPDVGSRVICSWFLSLKKHRMPQYLQAQAEVTALVSGVYCSAVTLHQLLLLDFWPITCLHHPGSSEVLRFCPPSIPPLFLFFLVLLQNQNIYF